MTDLHDAAVETLRAHDAVTDAVNGRGHPDAPHDHVLGDIRGPHDICDTVSDCSACGGAQYGSEDDLNRAIATLRLAVGHPPKPWEERQ